MCPHLCIAQVFCVSDLHTSTLYTLQVYKDRFPLKSQRNVPYFIFCEQSGKTDVTCNDMGKIKYTTFRYDKVEVKNGIKKMATKSQNHMTSCKALAYRF